MTWADWLSREKTPGSLQRATELEPANARWLSRLAVETGSGALLGRAAEANPNDAGIVVKTALQAETQGDTARAERLLLAAANRDATYEPRWSLANFYYRQRRWEEFWHWSREAARINYGELRGLYRLCLRAEADGAVVFQRVTPDRVWETRQFLAVLLEDGHPSGVEEASARLLGWRRELGIVMEGARFLLARGRVDQAVRVWNRAVESRLLDRARVEPELGLLVGNPKFRSPVGAGPFDWRIPVKSGVSAQGVRDGLRLEFSGQQPEYSVALEQALPGAGGREYTLATKARTELLPGRSGFRWRVVDPGTGIAVGPASEPIGNSPVHQYMFRAPAGAGVLYLQLTADREPGLRRPEGVLELQEVTLAPVN